ncbi:MAG: discoidin domain-containing protein [Verrucomicrobia bacterium]|nr:discoidin domain-containing protein [Verrucomicrobiota bacterium]
MKILITLALFVAGARAGTVDLTGEWRFALDPGDLGAGAKPADWRFPDKIRLPGVLTAQGFGETPSIRTKWTGDGWRYPDLFKEWQADDNFKFPFFLQPPKQYVGPAWYQRDFEWQGGGARLFLERVHWQSAVWLDGREMGKADSLGTPHEFDLGEIAAGNHTLTLRIDNRLAPVNVGPLSHSVTDHTQGNWNGVVGRMEVKEVPGGRVKEVRIETSADGNVRLRLDLINRGSNPQESKLTVTIHELPSGREVARVGESVNWSGGEAGNGFEIKTRMCQRALECKLSEPVKTWNEFSPALYEARVRLESKSETDSRSFTFGFREVGTKDGRITINGRKTFLRGTLECCIFPLTGHPPTDVESWKRIVGICKAHGLNHIRFHSWCPPEAAFVAADELGFYYQVEMSSWANQGAEIGSGKPLDEWMEAESRRVLAAYGNHPSFLLMAYGNEPAGANHPKWLREWVARRKAEDPRRLYTTGAGWPVMKGSDYHSSPDPRIQGWGQGMGSIINGQPPRTDFDWSDFVKRHPDAPVISHEIGQWCVYPNFDEIAKYTGYFKARNFEIFRETARRNGLLDQARDFLMASGKLQALAYKHDIEAALRTPGFGGFQLLDLHDFPGQGTALVGVLDAFWDEKGYIKPEEFRRFCGPIVPLARMKKMIYQSNGALEAELEVAQFGPEDLKQAEVAWSLVTQDGVSIGNGKLSPRDLATGELHRVGAIQVPLGTIKRATKAVLTVTVGQGLAVNAWDVFVYPVEVPSLGAFGREVDGDGPESAPKSNASNVSKVQPGSVVWVRDLDAAKEALAKGCKVLWLPGSRFVRDDPSRPLVAGFSPIFWNTAWTNWQPPHTLGILCDPKHPALREFPTDLHSNWQWWGIQHRARPFILTKHPDIKPIVQVIDDWVTNRKLGYVFEAKVGDGKLLACSADLLLASADEYAATALLFALMRYVDSDRFDPTVSLRPSDLDVLVRNAPILTRNGSRAMAESSEKGYEADLAIDGDTSTLWHTEFTHAKPEPPHEWQVKLRKGVEASAILLTQRQDHNPNGQVAEAEILVNGKPVATVKVPKDAVAFRIPLPAGTKFEELRIRVLKSHAGPFACLAEVDLEPLKKP